MNPFIFSPRTVNTASAARYILNLYHKEASSFADTAKQLEDDLAAVRDVLNRANPSLAADLDLLIEKARYAGHADGHAQDLAAMAKDFQAALPWEIKKEMAQPHSAIPLWLAGVNAVHRLPGIMAGRRARVAGGNGGEERHRRTP